MLARCSFSKTVLFCPSKSARRATPTSVIGLWPRLSFISDLLPSKQCTSRDSPWSVTLEFCNSSSVHCPSMTASRTMMPTSNSDKPSRRKSTFEFFSKRWSCSSSLRFRWQLTSRVIGESNVDIHCRQGFTYFSRTAPLLSMLQWWQPLPRSLLAFRPENRSGSLA